jgi:parallel beta-helix repeat protein
MVAAMQSRILGKLFNKARGRNAVDSAVRSLRLEALEGRTLLSAYTVSTSGSDSNNGSASAPWKSLQKAADTVKAGDVVTVQAGDYEGFSAFGLRGTAAAPIKFTADGQVNIVTRATRQTAIDVGIELSGYDSSSGSAYVEIEGFTVNNASGTISGGGSSGFRVRYSNNITLRNCKALNNGWVGMYSAYNNGLVIDGGESAYNNAYVDASTQRNHGIYVANSSSNVTVRNVYVHDNNGNGIHNNGDGGVNRNILIENNRVAGNGANGGSAINNDGIVNSIIRNNVLWNNKNKGIALYAIDAAASSTGNIIVNNTVVQASGNAALQLKDGATGNTVYKQHPDQHRRRRRRFRQRLTDRHHLRLQHLRRTTPRRRLSPGSGHLARELRRMGCALVHRHFRRAVRQRRRWRFAPAPIRRRYRSRYQRFRARERF